MFVPLGGQVQVEDLIRGMIVQSGNDACIVLAEGIAGSEDQFVELMNQKAKELGLTNSQLHATAPAGRTGRPATCPAATSRCWRADLISDFPEYYHYDSREDVQVQQYRAGEPQSAGAEGHRGRAQDRPHRGGRLWALASALRGTGA